MEYVEINNLRNDHSSASDSGSSKRNDILQICFIPGDKGSLYYWISTESIGIFTFTSSL